METDTDPFDDVSMEMDADTNDDVSMELDFDSDYDDRLLLETYMLELIRMQLERMMSQLMTKEEVLPFARHVRLLNKWRRDESKAFTTRVVLVMLENVLGQDSDVHSDLTAFIPYDPENKEKHAKGCGLLLHLFCCLGMNLQDLQLVNRFISYGCHSSSLSHQFERLKRWPLMAGAIYLSDVFADLDQRLFSNGEQLPPEIEIYLHLVVLVCLIDQHNDGQARDCASASIDRLKHYNRRTFGAFSYKHYFYYSLSHERGGDLASIRGELYNLYSLAASHRDELGQEILLNLLLRNYLHYKLYDQAEILSKKVVKIKGPLQICRYRFYVGKIQTIRLEYTDARESLLLAARIAPAAARGFQIQCTKWTVIVRLLIGEIPERTIFMQTGMTNALMPYFELTNAIRIGNLDEFRQVAARHVDTFNRDHTDKFVVRLKHSAIKTGLRNISISYSRISLADFARKLRLNNNQDLEHIVAKAIRDGIIEAKLDHANGWMVLKKNEDVYYTNEPQAAFHSRIMACLDLHNRAVRALRFPWNHHTTEQEAEEDT
ncbi:putative 26S proteasome non-ATPase regulatory subunit 3 [Drosera capensis]